MLQSYFLFDVGISSPSKHALVGYTWGRQLAFGWPPVDFICMSNLNFATTEYAYPTEFPGQEIRFWPHWIDVFQRRTLTTL